VSTHLSEAILRSIDVNKLETIGTFLRANPHETRPTIEGHFARLQAAGRIRSYPLIGHQVYYVLTSKECKARGLSPKRSLPFGPVGLVANYSSLLYCSDKAVRRRTGRENEATIPELLTRGFAADRYVRHGDGIGLLICDCGAFPRHIAGKAIDQWSRRRAVPAWKEILHAQGFTLIIVLGDKNKADHVERRLFDKGVRYEFAIYPELQRFFLKAPTAKAVGKEKAQC